MQQSENEQVSPPISPKSLPHLVSREGMELYRHYTREDRYTSWVYQPHTLTILSLAIIALIYLAIVEPTKPSIEARVKTGLATASAIFLIYAALQFKDTLFVRPHPVIWRIVNGVGILYLMLLVFMLFQTVDDARWLLSKLDPSLGKPLPERTYAANCGWKNFVDTLYDEFILSHFLGSLGQTFLFRHWALCWAASILFEITEISFEHMLPNFAECWWDHLILDVFGMNLLGFIIGMWILNKLNMKRFAWIEPAVRLDQFDWEILSSPKRLLAGSILVLIVNQALLNAFFMKTVLWIPPPHYLNVVRLILWWGIGLSGCREYYQYCTDNNCKKLGPMSCLCLANVTMELLVCIKFGRGMFPKPAPAFVVYGWITFLFCFFLWAIWFYGFRQPPSNQKKLA